MKTNAKKIRLWRTIRKAFSQAMEIFYLIRAYRNIRKEAGNIKDPENNISIVIGNIWIGGRLYEIQVRPLVNRKNWLLTFCDRNFSEETSDIPQPRTCYPWTKEI